MILHLAEMFFLSLLSAYILNIKSINEDYNGVNIFYLYSFFFFLVIAAFLFRSLNKKKEAFIKMIVYS